MARHLDMSYCRVMRRQTLLEAFAVLLDYQERYTVACAVSCLLTGLPRVVGAAEPSPLPIPRYHELLTGQKSPES